MPKTDFRLFPLFFILAGLALLTWPSGARAEFRVGVLAAFSGQGAAYGKAYRDGLELALEQSPGHDIKLIYEDDQFTPRLSVQAARKLISVDRVDALIVGDTSTARALIGVVRGAIPVFVWASESADFEQAGIIRSWPREAKELQVTQQHVESSDFKNIALLVSSHDYTLNWGRGMQKLLGRRVTYYEEFSQDPNDYRSVLLKLKAANVQTIGLCLNNPKNGQLASEAAELRLKFSYFGCNFLQSASDAAQSKGALKGAWYVDTPVSDEFRVRYVKRTGGTDYLNAGAVMHDIMQVILTARRSSLNLMQIREMDIPQGANGHFKVKADKGIYFDFDFVKVLL